jgi:Protein of unknown function (DUF2934)
MSSKSKGQETQATSGAQEQAVKTSTGTSLHLEEIRIRAYEIYVERDGQPGDELSDWLQAEREIESKARSNS